MTEMPPEGLPLVVHPEPLSEAVAAVPSPRRARKGRRSDRSIPLAPGDPACWAWPPFRAHGGMSERKQMGLLYAWHKGRCGICAVDVADLVTDHSHRTGKVRGLLCDDCNLTEGTDRDPEGVFARWRACPSASILGLDVVYVNPVTGVVAEPMPDKPLGPEYLPDWAPKRDRRQARQSEGAWDYSVSVGPIELTPPPLDSGKLHRAVVKVMRDHVPDMPESELFAVAVGAVCVAEDRVSRRAS